MELLRLNGQSYNVSAVALATTSSTSGDAWRVSKNNYLSGQQTILSVATFGQYYPVFVPGLGDW